MIYEYHPNYETFLQLCDRLQNALIYNLTVRNSVVLLEPAPRVLRQVPRPKRGAGPSRDQKRNARHQLVRACRQVKNGCFELIRVEQGVPCAYYTAAEGWS